MKRILYLLTTVIILLCAHGCISASRAQKHNVALNKCLDYGSPSTYKIVNLLYRHDYKALDKWFENMQLQYKQDAQYECYLDEGYSTFNQRNMPLQWLDAWVDATGSAIAYTARGVYKAKQGFGERGVKFSSETRPDQFSEMQRYHNEAAKDLQTAISKDPSLMPAYTWLIRMAKASDMPYNAKQIIQKAEENDKQSYSVRYAYMQLLWPSWGGSLEEMTEFASRESQFTDSNPRLWSLQGEADVYRGSILHNERNCASAVELYTAALQFGDNSSVFTRRSLCYSSLGKKELSRADLEKFRYYALRETTGRVPGEPADVAGLNFEVKENTTIDPLIGTDIIRSHLVWLVDQPNQWPDDLTDVRRRAAKRTIDKIELMVMRLGRECVDRTSLNSILDDRKISLNHLNDTIVQTVGQLMGAGAVILTSNSDIVNHNTGTYSKSIYIRALSVSTGKTLWESRLNGSVVVDKSLTNLHELIFDTIETKLFNALEIKLQKEINQ